MADSHHIIDGQVVPFSGGRKSHDTDSWRDATPLELQLQEELQQSEQEIDTLRAQLEAAEARAEAAEANAARYEWLRDAGMCPFAETDSAWDSAEELDAAIDAAMARTKEETNHE